MILVVQQSTVLALINIQIDQTILSLLMMQVTSDFGMPKRCNCCQKNSKSQMVLSWLVLLSNKKAV